MVGTRHANKEHITSAVLFAFFFFVPLFLTPVFPKVRILQAINGSGTCVVLLAVFAACTSGLITWITFRRKTTD